MVGAPSNLYRAVAVAPGCWSRMALAARVMMAVLVAMGAAFGPALAASARAADPFADLALLRLPRVAAAPDFMVTRLGSGSIALKDLRGHGVLLNFWATWCVPCKAEMPAMERLYRRHKDRGFTIVAISIDAAGVAPVAAFVRRLGLTFPIGLDPSLEVANRYTVRAVPSTFLIDRKGSTVAVAAGPREWDGTAADAVVETLSR